MPRVRRKAATKALGVAYPACRATVAVEAPAASSGRVAWSRARRCHWPNEIPGLGDEEPAQRALAGGGARCPGLEGTLVGRGSQHLVGDRACVFAGSDSLPSLAFRMLHLGDTMVLVDPGRLSQRLIAVGFEAPTVTRGKGRFRFSATKRLAAR